MKVSQILRIFVLIMSVFAIYTLLEIENKDLRNGFIAVSILLMAIASLMVDLYKDIDKKDN